MSERIIELTEQMVAEEGNPPSPRLRRAAAWLLIETAKLVPAILFLILWMVALSAWLAPYIDGVMTSLNEAACARGLTTQCPPPCEYRSQKGCAQKTGSGVLMQRLPTP